MHPLHALYRFFSSTLVISLLLIAHAGQAITPNAAAPILTPGDNSLLFIENVGQFDPRARFLVRGGAQTLWLADDALWVSAPIFGAPIPGEGDPPAALNLKLCFDGANSHPHIEPFNRQETRLNYYLGSDPARWRSGVPVWGGVRYVDLYPGVDLEVYGQNGQWAWRLVGNDGSLDRRIGELISHLQVEGAGQTDIVHLPALNADPASLNVQPQEAPAALLLGTYLGGSGADSINDMAVDASGAIYVTGYTSSSDFPSTPGLDSSLAGPSDAFVAQLDSAGSSLVYATFIGGAGAAEENMLQVSEQGFGIALDDVGNAYIVGVTQASDFPTTSGAYEPDYQGPAVCAKFSPARPCSDAFVVRLDASGHLTYGTYLGGTGYSIPGQGRSGGEDEGRGIAFFNGYVYVVGTADSDDFPTTAGAYKRTFANVDVGLNSDVFIAKMNLAGQGAADLVYSTFVGGGCKEEGRAIAVDKNGIVYATGTAYGDMFPVNSDFATTDGAFDRDLPQADEDAFVVKLNPAGNGTADLLYSTFLGTNGADASDWGYDWGRGIAVDDAGAIYVTGLTAADNFPTTSGAWLSAPWSTYWTGGFVSKLSPGGRGQADLVYSTYLPADTMDLALSGSDVYVTGQTSDKSFPTTPGTYDSSRSYYDAFVIRLRPQGFGNNDLIYSTFLGGGGTQTGKAVVAGQNDTVYVAGNTNSTYFPTSAGAYDATLGGGYDAFVARLQLTYGLAGRALDVLGQPVPGVAISVGGGYSAATDSAGWYTITAPAGSYTFTPTLAGYVWSPPARSATIPPSATGQDFIAYHLLKEAVPGPLTVVNYGDVITYTIHVVYPSAHSMALYEAIPTYTTYISGSLSATANVTYEPSLNAISGTLLLAGNDYVTATFAVRVNITGAAGFAPLIANQVRGCPPPGDSGDCEWSNLVTHYTYRPKVYLPVALKSY